MLDTAHSVTFANFRAFVDGQPPQQRYRYNRRNGCAVGCWLAAIGRDDLIDTDWSEHPVLGRLDDYAVYWPHTFGALAKRMRRAHRPVF